MRKHTEGPWEVERVNKADLRITAPSRHIAKLVRYGSAVEQNMDFGDAALIAAAPEMLEVLKSFSAMATSYGWNELPECRGDILNDTKKLLSKIKGDL